MSEPKISEEQIKADWLFRVDFLYRFAVHIVESIRDNKITDTDTISQLSTYFVSSKRLIAMLYSETHLPVGLAEIDRVDMAPLSEYIHDKKHWENKHREINNFLLNCREILYGLSFTKNKEIENEYVSRLSIPVNVLVAKYLSEKSKDGKEVIYKLTYNSLPSELMINGVVVARPKVSAANDFYELIFSQTGVIKKAKSEDSAPLNTASMINNLDIPDKLRSFLFTSIDGKKGMVVRTNVTASDIRNRGIDIEVIEQYLFSKRG